MSSTMRFSVSRNKILGAALLVVSIFAVLIIFHRFGYYAYEYDAQFAPVDYGKYNFLSFFTVQSNIFVCIYLTSLSMALLGVKCAEKIAFNPVIGTMVTTYIFVTGLVYCCGIPMGFTPPFKWDTPGHSITSFIQVFHHMIIPPVMVALWFFPMTNRRVGHKKLWIYGIYPLVYSLFSIVRGAVSDLHFYPYPFYRPDFIRELFFGDRFADNIYAGYALMVPVLIAGITLFIAIARVFIFISDKRIDAVERKEMVAYVKD